jgi:hypothetical protein
MRLGVWQKVLLAALKSRGEYRSSYCWRCGNLCPAHTIRILETLVMKGLVVRSKANGDVTYTLAENKS